jgi:uncharacterized protein
LPSDAANYFDLEDPLVWAIFAEPMSALQNLRGLVVIDEVQRRPELFPVLRVLADRAGQLARFCSWAVRHRNCAGRARSRSQGGWRWWS